MSDVIYPSPKRNPSLDSQITDEVLLGLVSLKDNHGNNFSRNSLTCAAKPSRILNYENNLELLNDVSWHEHFAALLSSAHDQIPMMFGYESPLQSMCRKLDVQAHHASASGSPVRTK